MYKRQGQDILDFNELGDVTMEYQGTDSLFYSGEDYLGLAEGVELTKQDDGRYA